MKGPLRWALFAWFLALNQPIDAQEPSKFEKILDISPDQKFAVLISCSSEPEDPNHIDSSLISVVKFVSLPSKRIVMDLQNYDGSAAHVIWSPDSNWLAFSSSSGPRVTDPMFIIAQAMILAKLRPRIYTSTLEVMFAISTSRHCA